MTRGGASAVGTVFAIALAVTLFAGAGRAVAADTPLVPVSGDYAALVIQAEAASSSDDAGESTVVGSLDTAVDAPAVVPTATVAGFSDGNDLDVAPVSAAGFSDGNDLDVAPVSAAGFSDGNDLDVAAPASAAGFSNATGQTSAPLVKVAARPRGNGLSVPGARGSGFSDGND